MEKAFIVKEGSLLYERYYAWKENLISVNKIVKEFFITHGIKTEEYYATNETLCIYPTNEDEENFKTQLCQAAGRNGERKFKKTSTIGKEWVKVVKDIKILRKPAFWEYVGLHHMSTRLFDWKDVLYTTISSEENIVLPEKTQDMLTNISLGEFYTVVDEIDKECEQ